MNAIQRQSQPAPAEMGSVDIFYFERLVQSKAVCVIDERQTAYSYLPVGQIYLQNRLLLKMKERHRCSHKH